MSGTIEYKLDHPSQQSCKYLQHLLVSVPRGSEFLLPHFTAIKLPLLGAYNGYDCAEIVRSSNELLMVRFASRFSCYQLAKAHQCMTLACMSSPSIF